MKEKALQKEENEKLVINFFMITENCLNYVTCLAILRNKT